MGLALGRYRFRGQGATNLLLFADIAAPELVMGASLLSLFVTLTCRATGFVTIIIAHVMFSLVLRGGHRAGAGGRAGPVAGGGGAGPRGGPVGDVLPGHASR